MRSIRSRACTSRACGEGHDEPRRNGAGSIRRKAFGNAIRDSRIAAQQSFWFEREREREHERAQETPVWANIRMCRQNLARTVGRRISRVPNFSVLVPRERRRRPPQAGRKGRNYRMRKPTAASRRSAHPGVIYVTHVYPLKQAVARTEEMNPNLVNDDGF